ncbi:MAG TPA: amidase [Gemmatimonadaceae bacterium]|nr:amidase [Gemmatimonadaceae bacterium]
MTLPEDVLYLSVRELGEALRARRFSPVELAESYLARLERHGPALGALVTTTRERALREAEQAEREIAAGRYRGPLHGVPYGVKDLLATRGYATTWGAAPYRDQRFDYDAAVVERLSAAGAVLVAKLSMVELAGGMGYSQANASFTGPGRTPWNTAYWSGGSSSGPAAAVAAALVPFAIGSETWGSIVFPAACCGVTGLRPTFGRVSRHGAMALSWTMDKLGPMARTADDCGLVLAAIAGADPRDALSAAAPYAYDGARDGGRAAASSRRMTIGVLRNATLGVQPEVARNFEASLAALGEFATLVRDVDFPDLPYNAAAETIIGAECASAFEELIESGRVRELTAPEDRWGGYAQTAVPARDYLKALRLRGPMAAAVDAALAPYDAVVSPTTDTVSYPVDRPFAEAWPPIPIPDGARTVPLGGAANLVGLPGVALPNGFGRDGLPTSIVFTGRAFQENAILRAAGELQRRTDWHLKRPALR